jgi:glutathione S-transferase
MNMKSAQSRIEIFGVPQSNFTRAVRIACAEKSIEYDYHPVPPHSPEVVAIHPLGKIPVLRHGELMLAESWPIASYLDRLFPQTPMILVGEAARTAEIEQWVSIVAMSVDPLLVREYAFAYLFPATPDGSVDRATVEEVLPRLKGLMAILDARVADTEFLAAGRFTFADALLLSTLAAVRQFPEGASAIAAAPNLSRYLERHSRRASLIATNPGS